jgi:hypothetical protein
MLDVDLPASGMLNRVSELDELERLVAGVHAGQSHVLVLRGEAGVGRTALLGHRPPPKALGVGSRRALAKATPDED